MSSGNAQLVQFADVQLTWSDGVQAKLPNTMLANWCLWPIAHTINFYYVPTNQRILYNNSIAVRFRRARSTTVCTAWLLPRRVVHLAW